MRLGPVGLKKVQEAIERLDSNGDFVKLDVEAQTVHYSSDFVLHDTISTYIGEEEPTRAFIVCWLCTVAGYLPPNIELEKRYSIGRPKVGAKLDILVKHPDGTAYALIEVKSPEEYDIQPDKFIKGQLFNLAPHEPGARVLSYATIQLDSDAVTVKTLSIDYEQHKSFDNWKIDRPSSNEIPTNYGEPVHVHFEKGGKRDLRTDVSINEFKKLRKRLHDVLWRGSTPDNTIYAYVVRLFLAKVFDEKTTPEGKKYKFQIYFSGSKRESPANTFDRINKLYLNAFERYLNVDGETHGEPLNNREFSNEQIAFIVELLQSLSLTKSNAHNADVLGSFFEGITREGFKQSKGLFFTHINIVVFILKVLQVEELAEQKIQSSRIYQGRLPYIIDPSCGSGTFLLTAMRMITKGASLEQPRV